MKYLKTYTLYEKVSRGIFESVVNYLSDILLEINDEDLWRAECWPDSQDGKWVVIIKTIDEDEEYELEGQRPPESVIEGIMRSIDFMRGEGFTNYGITFEEDEDDQYEKINLEDIYDLDVWPNNFIRIEFWK
jgi:hypothetical protein